MIQPDGPVCRIAHGDDAEGRHLQRHFEEAPDVADAVLVGIDADPQRAQSEMLRLDEDILRRRGQIQVQLSGKVRPLESPRSTSATGALRIGPAVMLLWASALMSASFRTTMKCHDV